jgi:hypothetical protein
MTPTITKRLFLKNLAAAVFCLLFLLFLVISLPSTKTLWTDREWATEQMQKAKTIDEMTQVFQMAIGRFGTYERMTEWLFGAVLIAGFVGFCFLCVNVFTIGRLHKEISKHDSA